VAQPRAPLDVGTEHDLRAPTIPRHEGRLKVILFFRGAQGVATHLPVFLHGGEQPTRGDSRGETGRKQRRLNKLRRLQANCNGPVEEHGLWRLASQQAPSEPRPGLLAEGSILLRAHVFNLEDAWTELLVSWSPRVLES